METRNQSVLGKVEKKDISTCTTLASVEKRPFYLVQAEGISIALTYLETRGKFVVIHSTTKQQWSFF